MLNYIFLAGRISDDPVLEEQENRKIAKINLSIPRTYKNAEGIYENDIIPLILYDSVAVNTCEYCKKNDVINAKGRLDTKDGGLVAIIDKVTFLSNKPELINEKDDLDMKI